MIPMPWATCSGICSHTMTDSWNLVYDEYDPEQEGRREALCTLGNGYIATRGAACEVDADDVHYPGTYVAGLYNKLVTRIAGRDVWNEDLVNVPNWLSLKFRIEDGEWFHPDEVELLDYRQTLDLKRGLLRRELRFRDAKRRTTRLRTQRFVSMSRPHLAGEMMVIVPEDWSGRVEIVSALDGGITNSGVARYRELSNEHLEPLERQFPAPDQQLLCVQTNQSGVRIAIGARTRLYLDDHLIQAKHSKDAGSTKTQQVLTARAERGQELAVEKICSLYTSRDRAVLECIDAAQTNLGNQTPRFSVLARRHRAAWAGLWDRFDLDVEAEPGGIERTTLILRLHVFHLLQTVSPYTLNAGGGVPARGLHGEAYRGHVFWDELFILPVFNLRMPELTRAMLMYRFWRLPAACNAAAEGGYRGAMYPWQSATDGTEQTQTMHLNPASGDWIPDRSHRQRHVGLAVAYNIWQYYQATGDLEFLNNYGGKMFLEISRFWASMARYNRKRDRYEIHGVMGPDEYHDGYPGAREGGLKNNAYTNVMVAWLLWRVFDLIDVLPESRTRELLSRMEVDHEELQRWEAVSKNLLVVFQDEGIISQFEGYEDLEEFDWEGYREKYEDIRRLDRILGAEGDTPNRYKLSKQADVLMLFYLLPFDELEELFGRLGYPLKEGQIRRNVDYYLERTSGGSTLSEIAHAHVLAQLDPEKSWQLFARALRSDIDDVQVGTTPEGIHLGAMAGTVDLLQRCFVGVEPCADVLALHPCLPRPLTRLRLTVHYRGHVLRLDITRDRLGIRTDASGAAPINLLVQGKQEQMSGGERRRFDLN